MAAKNLMPLLPPGSFLGGNAATATTLGLVAVAFIAGVVALARWAGPRLKDDPQYRWEPQFTDVTPTPPWIPVEVSRQVFEDGGLKPCDIRDRELTLHVARAFSNHPWVESVSRVRKVHPNRLEVELKYRRPVAMVEVTTGGQRGALPVDGNGVLLPTQGFSETSLDRFLRVSVPETAPAGLPGASWGDPRVQAAAELADFLRDHWRRLGIYRIHWLADKHAGDFGSDSALALEWSSGGVAVWGSPLGKEEQGELGGEAKLRWLILHWRPGSVAEPDPSRPMPSAGEWIDLRRPPTAPEATGPTASPTPTSP